MKEILVRLGNMPKWYGIGVVLLYSILLAEFFSALNTFIYYDDRLNRIMDLLLRANYFVTVASGIVVWIIMSLLFHLTVLLFDGYSSFSRFLYSSSYFYLIPGIFILVAILLLNHTPVETSYPDAMALLQNHPSFKLAMSLVNYSFIPYYLLCMTLIHHLYKVRFRYAIASVVIPILSIWTITKLFTLL